MLWVSFVCLSAALDGLSNDEDVDEHDDAGDDGQGAGGEAGAPPAAGGEGVVVLDHEGAHGDEHDGAGQHEDDLLKRGEGG